MQIELPFPVLFRKNDAPALGNEYTVAWDLGTFDIAERDPDEMPDIVRFRRQHAQSDLVFRLDTVSGGFAAQGMKFAKFEALLEAIRQGGRVEHEFSGVFPDVKRAMETRISGLLSQGATISRHYEMYTRHMAPFRDASREDIAFCKAEFETSLAGLSVCGGRLYRAVEEPVFAVYRTNVGWKTELLASVGPRLGGDGLAFHFSLDRFDEMENFKRFLSENAGKVRSPVTVDRFELLSGYETTVDAYALDVEFLAADFAARINDALKENHRIVDRRERTFTLDELPDSVVDTYMRTRRFLATPREERSEDMVGSMLQAIVSSVEDAPKTFRNVLPKAVGVAMHAEKWHSRPIGLILDRDFAPPRP